MNSDLDTSVYKVNKKKMILFSTGSFIFVALGVLLIFDGRDPFEIIIGVLNILFFGLGIYIFISRLLSSKAGLVIDSQGITDNTKFPRAERIGWKEIRSIRVRYGEMLIELNDPEDYLRRKKGILNWAFQLNRKIYGTPAIISFSMLRVNFKEMCQDIAEKLNKYNPKILR
ncbi:MAG: STM3941 family protein [Dehalococcoidales bacterium]|nr:STM3941 family protein [Dehalococcoidales bacterium]